MKSFERIESQMEEAPQGKNSGASERVVATKKDSRKTARKAYMANLIAGLGKKCGAIKAEAKGLEEIIRSERERDDALAKKVCARLASQNETILKIGEKLDEAIYAGEKDPLTLALNRRGFEKAVRTTLRQFAPIAKRGEGAYRHVALLMIDGDNFKKFNDTYGHSVGDAVLVAIAGELRGNIRATDAIGRIGGEEFAVIFPGASARDVIRMFRGDSAAGAPGRMNFKLAEVDMPVSVSGGVTEFMADDFADHDFAERGGKPTSEEIEYDFEAMIEDAYKKALARADALLMAAKGNGKDQIIDRIYDDRRPPDLDDGEEAAA